MTMFCVLEFFADIHCPVRRRHIRTPRSIELLVVSGYRYEYIRAELRKKFTIPCAEVLLALASLTGEVLVQCRGTPVLSSADRHFLARP